MLLSWIVDVLSTLLLCTGISSGAYTIATP